MKRRVVNGSNGPVALLTVLVFSACGTADPGQAANKTTSPALSAQPAQPPVRMLSATSSSGGVDAGQVTGSALPLKLLGGPSPGDVAALPAEVRPGDSGTAVDTVQKWLKRYGYLPNPELSSAYPTWQPLVDQTPTPGVYDQATHNAVVAMQRFAHIPESGVVDDQTRRLMQSPRCGVPEGIAPHDPSEKYLYNKTALANPVTWFSWDVPYVQNALDEWSAHTELSFTNVPNPRMAKIVISFDSIDGPDGILAQTDTFFRTITVDNAELWTMVWPAPTGYVNLQVVLEHELGHALVFGHSNAYYYGRYAIMWPYYNDYEPTGITLTVDDKVGISAIYDQFNQNAPCCLTDIGVGGTSENYIWGRGTNGYLYRWYDYPGTWFAPDPNMQISRIATGPTGIPYVISSSNNQIYYRDPNSGNFISLGAPYTGGGFSDVAVGRTGYVWGIDTYSVSGGYRVWAWDGFGWHHEVGNGGAVRIAADDMGVPWVINNTDGIFRRNSGEWSTGYWYQLPGAAKDIGVNPGSYAWVIGTNSVPGGYGGIFSWSEQNWGWTGLTGGAVAISAGFEGEPWVVSNDGHVYRPTK